MADGTNTPDDTKILATGTVTIPADAELSIKAGDWSLRVHPEAGVGPHGRVGVNHDDWSVVIAIEPEPEERKQIVGGSFSEHGGVFVKVAHELEAESRNIAIEVREP